uniref:Uncharacterized protein n=1 Tax=Heterorhabditis bacteriophora TaxID=37862 RepID=A0A1I7WP95_HETBA
MILNREEQIILNSVFNKSKVSPHEGHFACQKSTFLSNLTVSQKNQKAIENTYQQRSSMRKTTLSFEVMVRGSSSMSPGYSNFTLFCLLWYYLSNSFHNPRDAYFSFHTYSKFISLILYPTILHRELMPTQVILEKVAKNSWLENF